MAIAETDWRAELWTEHEWQSVLHHNRTNSLSEQQARRLWQGSQRHGRSNEGRAGQDWREQQAKLGRHNLTVWRDVMGYAPYAQ